MTCDGKESCVVGRGCFKPDEELGCNDQEAAIEQQDFNEKVNSDIKATLKFSCCQGNLCNDSSALKLNFLFCIFIWDFIMVIFLIDVFFHLSFLLQYSIKPFFYMII